MSNRINTFIATEPIGIEQAYSFVSEAGNGAVNLFTGTVRSLNDDRQVTGITYDGHRRLAEQTLQDIATEASTRWPQIAAYVGHFLGRLEAGGISVIIAVGSPHRQASFDACQYVIEQIKLRAPIWKQEHYSDGTSAWLTGHSLNETDLYASDSDPAPHGSFLKPQTAGRRRAAPWWRTP